MRRVISILFFIVFLVVSSLAVWVYARYGGGIAGFPDLSTEPVLGFDQVETVAELDTPPGNIAVSADGRVFLSLHPEARPELKVVELVGGVATAYPDAASQSQWRTPLGVRVDQQQRLWVLDASEHGFYPPSLIAYDIESGKKVHHYKFPEEIMGAGSHANDFQVTADGKAIVIADASIMAKTPALIVYDIEKRRARRVLSGAASMLAGNFVPVVQGRKMTVAGVFDVSPGVDSIALDRQGKWLYFAAVNSPVLYRIPMHAVLSPVLGDEVLEAYIEVFADKTMSDGITTDDQGNIYLSDLEHDAIIRLDSRGQLTTLLKDQRIRWPDGFSFGQDGWLYFTCSALHHVIGKLPGNIESQSPYQVYRFKPALAGSPVSATPGH